MEAGRKVGLAFFVRKRIPSTKVGKLHRPEGGLIYNFRIQFS
jgi:hypothetical protein